MSTEPSTPDVVIVPRSRSKEETRTRRVPPYHVILENDEHHSFEFVMTVLRKALGYAEERAFQLTLEAHTAGRAAVWTGPREVAELKADQMRTYREVRGSDGARLGPVGCTVEPAPG